MLIYHTHRKASNGSNIKKKYKRTTKQKRVSQKKASGRVGQKKRVSRKKLSKKNQEYLEGLGLKVKKN